VRDYTAKVPQEWSEESNDSTKPDLANQLGTLILGAEPVVTVNGDFDSFRAAFDKRSNSQPDKDDDCTPVFMKAANKLWNDVFDSTTPFEPFDIDDIIYERWMSKFDDAKRQRMERATERLPAVFDQPQELGRKELFVKVEALLKRYDAKWAPRLIYQGSDEFNALTGPVAMVICERLKELFDSKRIGPISVKMAYKANDVDLAEHLVHGQDEGLNHTFEADFSANDLRQRYGANVVFQLVCRRLGAPSWFVTLLDKMSSFTVVNYEFGLRAQLDHQLPTGTTITTPRNTVWNVTIEAVHAIENHNAGRAVVLGDDWLAVMLRKVIGIAEWTEEHPKMKMTTATPSLSGEATFLSRRVCVYSERPCLVPKLGKALARFNARANANASVSDSAYMAGKALSYAYEFRHIPLLRDLFLIRYRGEGDKAQVSVSEVSWFTRTSGINLDGLEELIMKEKVLADEDQTREFLMDAYGDEFGLVDALDISRRIILGYELTSIEGPAALEVDY
jgi:hypothetical protein